MEQQAQTVVAVARDGSPLGLIGIADQIKPDAAEAVARLRERGIQTMMLTGDTQATADAVAAQANISDARGGLLPDDKARIVRELQTAGHRVMFVGDGINDAPALTQADIGIAIGAGTDIAIESSDVVLVGNRLTAVADARDIGVESFTKTKQNLTVAFAFNGIGVPAAVSSFVGPVWAMLAMVASVSTVLANSFGARISTGSVRTLADRLAGWGKELASMARPATLAQLLARPAAGGYTALLAFGVLAGAVWTILAGHPYP
jgi:P-type E1-E2 ATPase